MAVMTAMAGVALMTAACGGSSHSSAATGGSAQYDAALAYAHCMRSHGVRIYPDPNSQGELTTIGTVGGPMQQTMLSAENACRHLLERYNAIAGQMNPAQQQQFISQLVKYAECMRAHGVPGFPDPTVGSGGIAFNYSGPTESPQFITAQQACKSLASKPGS